MKISTLIFILYFSSFNSYAQKWYKPTKRDIIGYGMITVSGISYGINQAVNYHKFGEGNPFIDINISWKNKYKDYTGGDLRPAYLGSKTWLVWTTDLNHLSATANHLFLAGGVYFLSDIKGMKWYAVLVKKIIYPMLLRGINIELTFKKLKK